jgi:hypothetical protein
MRVLPKVVIIKQALRTEALAYYKAFENGAQNSTPIAVSWEKVS